MYNLASSAGTIERPAEEAMYNYNTVSGKASLRMAGSYTQAMAKLAIATGHLVMLHCMQVFNDLQYSNRCKFVRIS